MINTTMCNYCVHQPVCKEQGDYIKIVNTLNDFGVRDRIGGEIHCKHYFEIDHAHESPRLVEQEVKDEGI